MAKNKIKELINKINNRDAERGQIGSAYPFINSLSNQIPKEGEQIDRDLMMNQDDEKQYLEMTISSETPIEDWFGVLTLDHSEQSIVADRLKTGASFRDGHYGDQVGIISNYSITQKRQLKI